MARTPLIQLGMWGNIPDLRLPRSCCCRGPRIEVRGLQAYDTTRLAEFLGQSWLSDSYVKINTDNSVNGWSGWPSAVAGNAPTWVIKVRIQREWGWRSRTLRV